MGRSIGSALTFAFFASACGDDVEVGPWGSGGGGAGDCSSSSDCEDASYCAGAYDNESEEYSGTCEAIPSNRFLCGDHLLCFRDSEACVEKGDLGENTIQCEYFGEDCASCDCFVSGLCPSGNCGEHDGEVFVGCL